MAIGDDGDGGHAGVVEADFGLADLEQALR